MTSRDHASRQAWISAYLRVLDALPEPVHGPCPNCGHETLRIAFRGDRDEPVGNVFFWCDTCLLGIAFGRVEIPEGVDVLPRGMQEQDLLRRVPNYALVPADLDDGVAIEEG